MVPPEQQQWHQQQHRDRRCLQQPGPVHVQIYASQWVVANEANTYPEVHIHCMSNRGCVNSPPRPEERFTQPLLDKYAPQSKFCYKQSHYIFVHSVVLICFPILASCLDLFMFIDFHGMEKLRSEVGNKIFWGIFELSSTISVIVVSFSESSRHGVFSYLFPRPEKSILQRKKVRE